MAATTTPVPSSTRTLVKAGLWFLAATQALVGVWAQVAPGSFYQDFPLGRGWVGLLPPYNEHLVRDVGGLSLALFVVLVAAALRTDRWSAQVAAVATAVFAVPHTVFHALHLEHFPPQDGMVQTVGTVGLCLVILAVWVLARRLGRDGGRV